MSLHDPLAPPGVPAHWPADRYCLSVARGNLIRTVAVAPALFWTLASLLPACFGAGVAGAAHFLFPDASARAVVARADALTAEAQDRLDGERGRFEAENSRRLVDQATLERRVSDLLARQTRLEQRDALVAGLATATANSGIAHAGIANSASGALQAIEALNPDARRAAAATGVSSARAYAPLSAVSPPLSRPVEAAPTAGRLSAAAANRNLDMKTRLDFAAAALDRVETGQMISLAAIDRSAVQSALRRSAILAEVGLDQARFASAEASVGVRADPDPAAPAFDRSAARVALDVASAARLASAIPRLPLRKPLFGDAVVTSPFGYRPDPFLGRPMLHAGVDLREPYGSEIHATAPGRVTHAGPMGGYGEMVEIDHGDGLTTRYGHMAEVDVTEGQDVAAGAPLGRLGSTGRSTGPHLHYEVRIDGEPVDPERFLRAGEQENSHDE